MIFSESYFATAPFDYLFIFGLVLLRFFVCMVHHKPCVRVCTTRKQFLFGFCFRLTLFAAASYTNHRRNQQGTADTLKKLRRLTFRSSIVL